LERALFGIMIKYFIIIRHDYNLLFNIFFDKSGDEFEIAARKYIKFRYSRWQWLIKLLY